MKINTEGREKLKLISDHSKSSLVLKYQSLIIILERKRTGCAYHDPSMTKFNTCYHIRDLNTYKLYLYAITENTAKRFNHLSAYGALSCPGAVFRNCLQCCSPPFHLS